MKLTKTKLAVASFGAALTTLHAAPELNADIVDLTFSPGSVAWSLTAVQPVVIDQLGFGFSQWNDSIGKTVSDGALSSVCLLYTSPSPRDLSTSRMPSSA